jgi:hypothetical protein
MKNTKTVQAPERLAKGFLALRLAQGWKYAGHTAKRYSRKSGHSKWYIGDPIWVKA